MIRLWARYKRCDRRVKIPTAVGGVLKLGAPPSFGQALAATDEGAEEGYVAVLELGATGEREISARVSHTGPAVGVEIEPIENWLEIEFGASTYRSQGPRTGNLSCCRFPSMSELAGRGDRTKTTNPGLGLCSSTPN